MLTQDNIRGTTLPRLDAILKDFLDDLDNNPISFPDNCITVSSQGKRLLEQELQIVVDFIVKYYHISRGIDLKYVSDEYNWKNKETSYKFKVMTT